VGEPASTVPPSQFLLDDIFNVLRKPGLAQSRQDAGGFGNELLRIVLNVDTNRIDLE